MKRKTNLGFTLIELMIVVAIIGVLAVLAIFGVSKYLKNAKTAEATNSLGEINRSVVAAYNKENTTPQIATGPSAGATHALCPIAAPLPAAPPPNQKYTAPPGTFEADKGWACIGFTMNQPQYFNYEYKPALKPGNANDVKNLAIPASGWGAGAAADFAGDGKFIEFLTGGDVIAGTPITTTNLGSVDVATGQPF